MLTAAVHRFCWDVHMWQVPCTAHQMIFMKYNQSFFFSNVNAYDLNAFRSAKASHSERAGLPIGEAFSHIAAFNSATVSQTLTNWSTNYWFHVLEIFWAKKINVLVEIWKNLSSQTRYSIICFDIGLICKILANSRYFSGCLYWLIWSYKICENNLILNP